MEARPVLQRVLAVDSNGGVLGIHPARTGDSGQSNGCLLWQSHERLFLQGLITVSLFVGQSHVRSLSLVHVHDG